MTEVCDKCGMLKVSIESILSVKQKEILVYLVNGYSFPEICEVMKIKEGTLASQCNRIYKKLGAYRRAEVVKIAIDVGFASP